VDEQPKDEENGDEDGDEDEEEYVVEKIMSHGFDEEGIKYEVKWVGFEAKKDRTWEPEENLEGAQEALEEYFTQIGGRPTRPSKKPKTTKRKSVGTTETPEPVGSARRKRTKTETPAEEKVVKAKAKWEPPKGSWEDHVTGIETVEEATDPQTGVNERWAYVLWISPEGRKTKHKLSTVNQKCPQKMLRYYEQHLYFPPPD
ncbi:hypothetical protein K490DRAFT_20744, partial [Saccharata proteae CBS 121410]